MMGIIYRFMKKTELARSSFESARIIMEKEAEKRPDNFLVHSSLGIIYAGLGRKEEAIRAGKHAVELLPVSSDAWDSWRPIRSLAWIYVMVEEYDLALDNIEYLVTNPTFFSISLLELHPIYDPLRSHPRYLKLVKK
jgi:tetratricopeptide (TPR) repeat protein